MAQSQVELVIAKAYGLRIEQFIREMNSLRLSAELVIAREPTGPLRGAAPVTRGGSGLAGSCGGPGACKLVSFFTIFLYCFEILICPFDHFFYQGQEAFAEWGELILYARGDLRIDLS